MSNESFSVLPGQADYPRNQWYVIAWSREIEAGKSLARDCCDDPVLLVRSQEGVLRAFFNRCPHRGMPMDSALTNTSLVEGDGVRCGYHGIRFGATGKAVEVPSGGVIPAKMAVHAYPVVERWEWVWIWMGDPAKADVSLIPDHQALGLENSPMHAEAGIYLHVKANYLLPMENLVDATHITYLHHGLIDSGNVAAHPYTCEMEGTKVSMIRRFENETLPEMLVKAMSLKGNRVNRTLTLTAYANHLCDIQLDFVEVGDEGSGPRQSHLLVAVTPETKKSTHHFAAMSTTFPNTHPGRFDDLRNLLMEDVVVIEQIQVLFDRLGEARAPEVSVKSDEGNLRTRRLIADMVRAERAQPVEATA